MPKPVLQHDYKGKDLEAMSFAKNYSNWIIELFSPFIGNNIAEIGAGTGNLTKLLSARNTSARVTAFEPSKKMHDYLIANVSKENRISTINASFSEVADNYKKHFDSIFYINVLEHIEDDDLEVKHMHDCLEENGYVCIFVPALSFLYSDFDKSIGHFRRYHKQQLRQLFEKHGFEIVDVKYIDMIGILPWYINFVLMKRTLDQNTTKVYDSFVIPIIRILDKLLPAPIGKNLLLVGKKKL